VNSVVPTAPTTAFNAEGFVGQPATLACNAAASATEYNWYTALTDGALVATTTSPSYTIPALSQTTTLYVAAAKQGCEASPRLGVTATILSLPSIAIANGQSSFVPRGGSITLEVTSPYSSYAWYRNGVSLNINTPTFEASAGGSYYVVVGKNGASGTGQSNSLTLTFAADGQNRNHIVSNSIQVSGVTNPVDVDPLPPYANQQSIRYFDGVGRLMQTVAVQSSPNKADVVQPVAYDALGRQQLSYLPYVSSEQTGRYKANALAASGSYLSSEQYQFYNNGTSGKVADDTRPYSETVFEASPLFRPLKVFGAGKAWYDSLRPQEFSYVVNEHGTTGSQEQIIAWTINASGTPERSLASSAIASGGYYNSGFLRISIKKDEEGTQVREYIDGNGNLILKKVQVAQTALPSDYTQWAPTYYIYDDRGNLRYVFQPELSNKIHGSADSYVVTSTDLDNFAFQYRYDGRNRMIEKRVPGGDWVYMAYDERDRLVMTQDGNQRAGTSKHWSFTKYDAFNRAILTGIYTADSVLSQTKMQRRVDDYYRNLPNNGGAWFEKYVGSVANSVHGYTNLSYPLVSNEQSYLTVAYYDNYDFKSTWMGNYNYVNESLSQPANGISYKQPISENLSVLGQITGTKTKVLDGNISGTISGGYTWLKSVSYYDDNYRVIQVIGDNYVNGYDRATNVYDFVGKALKNKTTHVKQGVTWKNIVGAKVEGNKLIRTATGTTWGQSGASSMEVLPANTDGWIEFVASELTSARMIGLADTDPDQHYTQIDHAIYLTATGTCRPFQNGTGIGTLTNYKIGDVFRIVRQGAQVTYYQNNTVIGQSTAVPSALLADASFSTSAGSLTRVSSSFSAQQDSVIRTYEYDHGGRLTKLWHRYNDGTNYLLTKNEYNELGQLVDKKLHSTDANAANAKQSVDMRYNIRGWITSINNSTLSSNSTNDDSNDLFGMNLTYNEAIAGLNNKLLYNGNIGAIKWSRNMGLSAIKEQAYNFKYDRVGRLSSASHKQSSSPDTWAPGLFNEDGLTYDLNGNIKTLSRTNEGLMVDNLVYNYGTGTTLSNKLLSVTDNTANATDKVKGFLDGYAGATDYTYDLNGNMTRDLNKGIGNTTSDATNIITYNFLNLPETVTKGSNRIRYIYDATGRKLSQVVTFQNDLSNRQTDYAGEHTYENNVLQFINHEEGRIVVAGTKLVYTNSANVTTDFTAINTTLAVVNQNDNQNYVKATSAGTTSGTGVFPIGAGVLVNGGERYKIRIKGYRSPGTASNPAYLLIKANNVAIGSSAASLPLKNPTPTESWTEQTVTVPGTGTQVLQVGVTWNTVTLNEVMWINEVEVIKLETQAPEYQYFLKDHLGNVRVTFTSNPQKQTYSAGFETANQTTEAKTFSHYPSGGQINTQAVNARSGTNSELLNGGYNGQVGVAKSIAVMPGDTVQIQAYAKYGAPSGTPGSYNSFVTSLLSAFNLSAPIAGETGTASYGVNSYGTWEVGSSGHVNSSDPIKVFATIILFDKNYNFIDVAYAASTSSGALITTSYKVKQPGYAYLYVSNEHPTLVDVYIDDVTITHIQSPVVQMEDYYPFGLTFNSCSRENTTANQYKFNGKEEQDDLNLGWLDYGARMYMPEIGRWGAIDLLASNYYDRSVYHFSGNNPLRFMDVDGRYYVGTDGKPVTTSVMDGKVQLSSNASPDLQRMASLINDSGSNTAISQFNTVGNNETKVNFRISQEVIIDEDGNALMGLHQAHDSEGNALNWNDETGTFEGDVAFTIDSDGNLIYEETTITIYEATIEIVAGETNKNSEMVVTNSHENEHDLNKKDIQAIWQRGNGGKNDRDVEKDATKVEEKTRNEIKDKKKHNEDD
jgi:RHS repeat-associated protein